MYNWTFYNFLKTDLWTIFLIKAENCTVLLDTICITHRCWCRHWWISRLMQTFLYQDRRFKNVANTSIQQRRPRLWIKTFYVPAHSVTSKKRHICTSVERWKKMLICLSKQDCNNQHKLIWYPYKAYICISDISQCHFLFHYKSSWNM